MSLFFDHYFNLLSAKIKINKNVLNFINPDGLEAFERQTTGTWLEIWVNHFEFDVIWRASQLFLKLHSHNSVLWCFCSISVISEFSYLGIGLKTKTRKSRKIFIFWIYNVRMHVDLVFNLCFNFLSVKTKINKKQQQDSF